MSHNIKDDRLTELECKFAFQHETIESLNKTVSEQWAEIDRLKKMILHLRDRLGDLEDANSNIPNVKPPHY